MKQKTQKRFCVALAALIVVLGFGILVGVDLIETKPDPVEMELAGLRGAQKGLEWSLETSENRTDNLKKL